MGRILFRLDFLLRYDIYLEGCADICTGLESMGAGCSDEIIEDGSVGTVCSKKNFLEMSDILLYRNCGSAIAQIQKYVIGLMHS